MELLTHVKANPDLIGRVLELEPDHFARVSLVTTEEMAVDDHGLVHGGFTFGLADYAAMVAVNHPNVVLVNAQAEFLKPVQVGDILLALARVERIEGKKRDVAVEIRVADKPIFQGHFLCYIPNQHVLFQNK